MRRELEVPNDEFLLGKTISVILVTYAKISNYPMASKA